MLLFKRNFAFLLTCVSLLLLSVACTKQTTTHHKKKKSPHVHQNLPPYVGNYNKEFNDFPDLHLSAAKEKGVQPLVSRADTLACLKEETLERIPNESKYFKIDRLKYSIPFLVPDAAELLTYIATDFSDSLKNKKLPNCRLVVTSVLRTEEDLNKLLKKNRNAVPESAHSYGTTFDISWKRFDRDTTDKTSKKVSVDKLKFILGQVLYNLKGDGYCYVKHERKQACFHITVR